MSPHRRGTSGYRGVRARPSGTFYGEIRSGDMRLGLGTFDTADDAARAYDAAVWHLNRPRREMNFPEVMTREWAQNLAPPLRVVTKEDRCRNRRRERLLGIAEMDEHAMAEWRRQFPKHILDEREFFAQSRAERRAEQAAFHEDMRMRKQATLFQMELKEESTRPCGDEHWDDAFITTEESDTDAWEEDDEE
ncbi:hypothetical protein ZWY2020_024570 [Hordeum vulgare]|nr:hypothetical protein ZWY2020_024570 [Hordeum vulgare]